MPIKKTSTIEITSFLKETGFIFEMEMAEILKKSGYKTRANQYFLDFKSGKEKRARYNWEKRSQWDKHFFSN